MEANERIKNRRAKRLTRKQKRKLQLEFKNKEELRLLQWKLHLKDDIKTLLQTPEDFKVLANPFVDNEHQLNIVYGASTSEYENLLPEVTVATNPIEQLSDKEYFDLYLSGLRGNAEEWARKSDINLDNIRLKFDFTNTKSSDKPMFTSNMSESDNIIPMLDQEFGYILPDLDVIASSPVVGTRKDIEGLSYENTLDEIAITPLQLNIYEAREIANTAKDIKRMYSLNDIKKLLDMLENKGLPRNWALAMIGNGIAESNLNLKAINLDEVDAGWEKSAGRGIWLWSNERRKRFDDFLKDKENTVLNQIEFAMNEIASRKKLLSYIMHYPNMDLKTATDIIYRGFEYGVENTLATTKNVEDAVNRSRKARGKDLTFEYEPELDKRSRYTLAIELLLRENLI